LSATSSMRSARAAKPPYARSAAPTWDRQEEPLMVRKKCFMIRGEDAPNDKRGRCAQ
jgi:hypothetical protein